MNETVSEVITYLAERKKLFFCYLWDIDRAYRRGVDGLYFGPGEKQLPRPDGTLDYGVLLRTLAVVGYEGVASLKCHGTAGWSLEYVTETFGRSAAYIRALMPGAATAGTAGSSAFAGSSASASSVLAAR